MKKIIFTALFLILSGYASLAQHEISVHIGGGLSALNYKTSVGVPNNSLGINLGMNLRYFISNKWSAVSGIEFGMYNSAFNIKTLNTHSTVKDGFHNNEEFDFRNAFTSYREQQGTTILQIPVMAHFYPRKYYYRNFIAGGIKLGIPLGGYYNSVSNIVNKGYYSKEDYEYEVQEFMGFGSFSGKASSGNLKFTEFVLILSLEGGRKFDLYRKNISVYIGVYIDYGLNNIYKKSEKPKPFVEYNYDNPRNFSVNSIILSQYSLRDSQLPQSELLQPHPQSFTNKINPMAVGIKISVSQRNRFW